MSVSALRFVLAFAAIACSTPSALAAGIQKVIGSDTAAGDQFGWDVDLDGDTMLVGAWNANAAYVYRWDGGAWIEEAVLVSDDLASGDLFGREIALDGDTALITARSDDDDGNGSGSAYIFVRSGTTWTQQAKLTAADAAANDNFGFFAALDGDTAVVTSRATAGGAGAAYVFVRSGSAWTQEAKLTPADTVSGEDFGWSAAISGDTILVGALNDNSAATRAGSAYVFTRAGAVWTEQAELTASDATADRAFGYAVALDGDRAVVGDYVTGIIDVTAGAAYIFERSGGVWTETDILTDPTGAAGDWFGEGVAVQGDTVVVGAPGDDGEGGFDGSVSVFVPDGAGWRRQLYFQTSDATADEFIGERMAIDGDRLVIGASLDAQTGADAGAVYTLDRLGDQWILPDQRLAASDGAINASYGVSVAISGTTAIVGAQGAIVGGNLDQGKAYVLVREGSHWLEQATLIASDGAAGDLFGWSVAIDGDTAVVGARDDNGFQGSAYVFTRAGGVWTEQAKLTASSGAAGDQFGVSVSIDGDTILVGATFALADRGGAYVFTRSGATWTEQATLFAFDGVANDLFGFSVGLDGDTAVIGAYGDNTNRGAAYIFDRVGAAWLAGSKLTASDGAAGDIFGRSVAIDTNSILVGALNHSPSGIGGAGAAYAFTRTGSAWTQQQKLLAPTPAAGEKFGRAVALRGDVAIVSADDGGGVGIGSAHWYQRTDAGWTEQMSMVSDDRFFGFAVAIDGAQSLVGAYGADAVTSVTIDPDRFTTKAVNGTTGGAYATLASAVNGASPADRILANPATFSSPTPTDLLNKPLAIDSAGHVTLPWFSSTLLADGASLNAAPGFDIRLRGALDIPANATTTLRGRATRVGEAGDIGVLTGATLNSLAGPMTLDGVMTAFPGSAVAMNGALTVGGDLRLFNAFFDGPLLSIDRYGRFIGDGTLSTSLTNRGGAVIVNDTLLTGDLVNEQNATLTVQIGTLTLLGSLTNNGTILGDLQTALRAQQTQPGDGFSVGGDYSAGPDASLLMSSDLWRVTVSGDFDVAIDDNTRYDMSLATLRIGASLPTDLEVMSADIGPSPDGLDRTIAGHYPIGALRLSGNTTTLVDAHDNDGAGQATAEALYVSALIIDAGATLETNGRTVYYETLTNNGSVDDPANLIQIAQCVADLTGDGQVDGADLGLLLGSWGTAQGDLNGDGVTDGADLGLLLGAWGPCP